jgi:two-component system, chemotaxis family, protein-glutamate methylesterase/glutaminase
VIGARSRDVVCIGAADGCVLPLARLIAQLPIDFPAAVFVVCRPSSPASVPDILRRCAALPVAEATNDETIASGRIRVGPRDRQLRFTSARTKLDHAAAERVVRPTLDAFFGSAASRLCRRVIGVLLGGGEDDGSEGARAIHSCGGVIVVAAPAITLAVDKVYAGTSPCRPDYRVPLDAMGALLLRLTAPIRPLALVAIPT